VGSMAFSKKNKTIIAPRKWSGLVSENMYEIVPKNWIKM